MNKSVTTLGMILLVILFVVPSFGQVTPITIDGDSADWVGLPKVSSINNPPGYFPGGEGGVGAMVNDTCDLRDTRIAVDDGNVYWFLRMWAEDAWPNFAYRELRSGVPSVRSRGYYHILLDLDNDRSTGWDPSYFEAHYTTLGYLISQAVYPADANIGAEIMMEVGISCRWSNEETRDSLNAGHVPTSISYWGADYSQYNGQLDLGSESDMYDMDANNVLDSLTYADGVMFSSSSMMTDPGASAPGIDTSALYFGGHAWSGDFIEVGTSYKLPSDYYLASPDYGKQFFQDGQTIAFVGHIETPMDDWGVDTGPRGEYTIPTGGGIPVGGDGLIKIDGDSSDWVGLPKVSSINNPPGYFPGGEGGVGAMVNDTCDLRDTRIAVDGGNVYWFLRMWAEDAWPNFAYRELRSGVPSVRSRGYYHILLDLDNDRSTGWDPSYFEAHYTTLGYLISQAVYPADANIGAEIMMEVGISCRWSNEETRDSLNAGHVPTSISYWGADYSQYNGQLDLGSESDMYDMDANNVLDSLTYADGVMFSSSSMKTDPGASAPGIDTTALYFGGHAWSGDFIEVGTSYKLPSDYYLASPDYGKQFFQDGQTIAFVGHIETPMDDWGVDTGPRGEYTIPTGGGIPAGGEGLITIDGDSSDWVGLPKVSSINNPPGYFPGGEGGVGAMVNDTCDLRDTRIAVDGGNVYWFLRMWAEDAWPNFAYRELRSGVPSVRSRGYYHILLDLDNDRSTGWDPSYFEAHYTTLGYLISQAVYPADANIGAEIMMEVGISCRWSNEETRDSLNAGHVPTSISYWGADYSQYNGQLDLGSESDMYDMDANNVLDSLTYADGVMFSSSSMMTDPGASAPGIDTTALYFGGHAWSGDFIEVGTSYKLPSDYYLASPDYGKQFFQDGQTIAFVGHIETPMDDWGVDTGPRGEYTIPTGGGIPTAIDKDDGANVVKKFALENNYPNPFNPVTTIKYQTPRTVDVSLVVYNALGQRIRTLVDAKVEQGVHAVTWNGRNEMGKVVSSGIYFYVLTAGDTRMAKKMILMR